MHHSRKWRCQTQFDLLANVQSHFKRITPLQPFPFFCSGIPSFVSLWSETQRFSYIYYTNAVWSLATAAWQFLMILLWHQTAFDHICLTSWVKWTLKVPHVHCTKQTMPIGGAHLCQMQHDEHCGHPHRCSQHIWQPSACTCLQGTCHALEDFADPPDLKQRQWTKDCLRVQGQSNWSITME